MFLWHLWWEGCLTSLWVQIKYSYENPCSHSSFKQAITLGHKKIYCQWILNQWNCSLPSWPSWFHLNAVSQQNMTHLLVLCSHSIYIFQSAVDYHHCTGNSWHRATCNFCPSLLGPVEASTVSLHYFLVTWCAGANTIVLHVIVLHAAVLDSHEPFTPHWTLTHCFLSVIFTQMKRNQFWPV